jgi:predicted ferric reductase
MNEHSYWYLSRASGIVAWVVLAATCLWGILLITRMLKPADRPAWLLDLHRYLGVLSIVTTIVHILLLLGDKWMAPTWKELFVPGGLRKSTESRMSPGARAAMNWGIWALYLMIVIQVSSWAMKRIPKKIWHAIHLTSYALFVMVTIHGFKAGSDTSNMVLLLTMAGIIGIVAFSLLARILQGRAKRIQRAEANALAGR